MISHKIFPPNLSFVFWYYMWYSEHKNFFYFHVVKVVFCSFWIWGNNQKKPNQLWAHKTGSFTISFCIFLILFLSVSLVHTYFWCSNEIEIQFYFPPITTQFPPNISWTMCLSLAWDVVILEKDDVYLDQGEGCLKG